MRRTMKRPNQLVQLIKVRYLLDMLKNDALTLVQVKSWRDVYEAYLARCELIDTKGKKIPVVGNDGRSVLDQYYGQCWANVDYPSELLWTARCPDEHGACIVSSKRKVKNILKSISHSERPSAGFGKVRYLTRKTMDARVRTAEDYLDRIRSGNAFLFEKRREFQDEREYRLILDLCDPKVRRKVSISGSGEQCTLNVDPTGFIDAIILDPRMSTLEAEAYTSAIRKLKPSLPVYQCDLYQPFRRQLVFDAQILDRRAQNQI